MRYLSSSSTSGVTSVSGKTGIVSLDIGDVASLQSILDTMAPKSSPVFTNIPTAPDASVGTNTKQIANTAFVQVAANKLQTDLQSSITNSFNSLDSRIVSLENFKNSFFSDNLYQINVGSTRTYKTIIEALDHAITVLFNNTVQKINIKVDAGTYTITDGILFDGLAGKYSQLNGRLFIEGDVTAPTNCKINFVSDGSGFSNGIRVVNGFKLILGGFTFNGNMVEGSNWTWQSLKASAGSILYCIPDSIVINNGYSGLMCVHNSTLFADGVVINNAFISSRTFSSSSTFINRAKLNYTQTVRTYTVQQMNNIKTIFDGYDLSPGSVLLSVGAVCNDTSSCYMSEAVIDGFFRCVNTSWNAYIFGAWSTLKNSSGSAVISEMGSSFNSSNINIDNCNKDHADQASIVSKTNAKIRTLNSNIRNTNVAGLATIGGYLEVTGSTIENTSVPLISEIGGIIDARSMTYINNASGNQNTSILITA